MELRLGDKINKLVMTKYLNAKDNGSLTFSPTEVTSIKSCDGIVFQLRYCPALFKKPTTEKARPENGRSGTKPDPFENPSEELLVARLPDITLPTHNLILNKYPVIPGHSIVSTVDFKKQDDLLDGSNLSMTYACLQEWETQPSDSPRCRLFAFFNSGEHSGASQPHRHLQLLPVEQMKDSSTPSWTSMIDLMSDPLPSQSEILNLACLPIQHFAKRIPPNPSPAALEGIYHDLLSITQEAVLTYDGASKAADTLDREGHDSLSYNLAMTLETMALCPRKSETASTSTGAGTVSVALNGTLLAGTMMVKDRNSWDALRHGDVLIDDILKQVGFQSL